MMMIEWIDYNEQPIMCVCVRGYSCRWFPESCLFFIFYSAILEAILPSDRKFFKKKMEVVYIHRMASIYIAIGRKTNDRPVQNFADYYDAKLNWINQSKRSINRLKLLQGNHHDYSIMIFSLVWKKIFSLQSPPVIMGVYTMF